MILNSLPEPVPTLDFSWKLTFPLCLSCLNGHKNHKLILYEDVLALYEDKLMDIKELKNKSTEKKKYIKKKTNDIDIKQEKKIIKNKNKIKKKKIKRKIK